MDLITEIYIQIMCAAAEYRINRKLVRCVRPVWSGGFRVLMDFLLLLSLVFL